MNRAGDIWLEVLEVGGNILPAPAWIAETHLGKRYATIREIGTPPPPTTGGEVTIVTTYSMDGYDPVTITATLKPKA